jgi:hypothetical protein
MKMLKYFMLLKLKFNKIVAFRTILYLDPAYFFIQGIKNNLPWLCENTYSPSYSSIKIDSCEITEWAAGNGNLDIVRWLYDTSANSGAINRLVVMRACSGGHLEVLKWLYSIGVHPTGDYVSIYTSHYGDLEYESLQICGYPQINYDHVIIMAAQKGHLDIVKWSVSVGADPGSNDNRAIKYASQNEHFEIVKWLVSIGVDPRAAEEHDYGYGCLG